MDLVVFHYTGPFQGNTVDEVAVLKFLVSLSPKHKIVKNFFSNLQILLHMVVYLNTSLGKENNNYFVNI